ncbi:MAG: hypothetical protein A2751_00245 [Candidatus Doudnabacteria bacterium RIFCSPHIGHO2_01_FULL_46_14]|uniref:Outer membrane protein beta-barrel domain-containing protein n=1 Tax=Candidatus Doudnabacteria bacterium RIFCSPHIGHO2_01_FULL_46_14 TaxID=1817824 RepID=A0A1F5NPS3_9BACT|nr:MAG: hypothetical protein A2751_00245 [Candidatus Doudnabacteria bacterium RIFCSPHIGHO2_01_FULL_46_14]
MRSLALILFLFVASAVNAQTPAGRTSKKEIGYGTELLPLIQIQPDQFDLTTGFSGNRVGEFRPITVKSGTVLTANLLASGYIRVDRWRFGGGVNLTVPMTRDFSTTNSFRMKRSIRVGPLVQVEHRTWNNWSIFGGYTQSRYTIINSLGRPIPLTVHQPHAGFKYIAGKWSFPVFGGPSWGEKSAAEDRISVNNKAFVAAGILYQLSGK